MPRKAKKDEPENAVPVRTPPKHGTFAPESGPSGNVVVDADAPGAMAAPPIDVDPAVAKAQAKAQAKAENEKVARDVKVRATRRGHMGHRLREEGDVFIIQLDKGQKLPSWVEAVDSENVPTTPVSHSAEAKEEVVDSAGIGHTPESLVKETVK